MQDGCITAYCIGISLLLLYHDVFHETSFVFSKTHLIIVARNFALKRNKQFCMFRYFLNGMKQPAYRLFHNKFLSNFVSHKENHRCRTGPPNFSFLIISISGNRWCLEFGLTGQNPELHENWSRNLSWKPLQI
jgi:hypothetical protein